MVSLVRRQQEPRRPLARREADPFRVFRDFIRDPFSMTPFFDLEQGPLRDMEQILTSRAFIPSVEVRETKDQYAFHADLPGVSEEDVTISIEGNRLTISGTREQEEEREEGSQYHVYERSYGTFTRSFLLPEGADVDNVKADLKNGVLTIQVPKKAGMGAKQIPIGKTTVHEMAAEAGQQQPEERAAQQKPEERKKEEKAPKAA